MESQLGAALIMGAVEGLTEFLPVSSTGHLIITGELIGFTGELASFFEIIIQLGAILAVVVLYRPTFFGLLRPRKGTPFSGMRGMWLLFLTTLPAGLTGLALHNFIQRLFSPLTVSMALAAGAVCMLLVERRAEYIRPRYTTLDDVTPGLALGIGCFQCLALWPGFSRSASTIMGAMLLGARRELAAEYSFIAAVPLMLAATAYAAFKTRELFSLTELPLFAAGMVFAFLFAWAAVKTFIGLMRRMTLRPFAWYRLALALPVYWLLAR